MRLFTNGDHVVLRTEAYRVRWPRKGEPAVEEVSSGATEIMLLAPDGSHDHGPELEQAGAVAACASGEDRVAAILSRDGAAALVEGPVQALGSWPREVALAGLDGPRVAWPAGLIWDRSLPLERLFAEGEAEGSGVKVEGGRPSISAGEWGIAVACPLTGIVGVLRPGDKTFGLVVRVPTQAEATVFAEATRTGALVTLVVEGRHSALLQITEGGAVAASREAWGSPPALVTPGGTLLYDQDEEWLYLLDDSLAVSARKRLGFDPLASAASADRRAFAFADDSHLILGRVTPSGRLSLAEAFHHAEFARTLRRRGEVEAARSRYEPRRPGGAPALGFAPVKAVAPWTAPAGEVFDLSFMVRSAGGSGRGLELELAGDALRRADFELAAIGGTEAPFQPTEAGSLVAILDDVELPEGLVYPLDPTPKNDAQKAAAAELLAATEIRVRVRGRAGDARSSDLLSVSFRARRSESPPLKWMRPLTIE